MGPLEELAKVADGAAGTVPLGDEALDYPLEVDGEVLGGDEGLDGRGGGGLTRVPKSIMREEVTTRRLLRCSLLRW